MPKTASSIFSMVAFTALASAVVSVLPLLVGAMVEDFGFSPSEAGLIAAADMFGCTVASLGVSFLIVHGRWRLVLLVGIFILSIANVLSGLVRTFHLLLVIRAVGGLGEGVLFAIGSASIGETRNPDRVFGLAIVGQLAFGAVALYLMPFVLTAYGLRGVFLSLAAVTLLGMLLIQHMPQRASASESATQRMSTGAPSKESVLGIAGVLTYFITQGGVWAYLDRMGTAKHFAVVDIANALAVSSIAGVIGGASSSWLDVKWGRIRPLYFAAACTLCALFAFNAHVSFVTFAVMISVFNFAWNFSAPYQFGVLAEIDPSRRTVVLAGAAAYAGLMMGPAIASALIFDGSYDAINWMGASFCIVSLMCFLRILRPVERKSPARG